MFFKDLCNLFNYLSKTTKRLEKTLLISDFLKKTSDNDLEATILLLRGAIFPEWIKKQIGISEKLIIKALSLASGLSEKEIINFWKEIGDLGEVASKILNKQRQSTLFNKELDLNEVLITLRKIASLEGEGSVDKKIKLLSYLLLNAKENSKYIIRIVLGELRLGVAEGILRDAIVWAYLKPDIKIENNEIIFLNKETRESYNNKVNKVQSALDRCNDFVLVAIKAKNNDLDSIKLRLGHPIKVMLAQREPNISSALDRLGRPSAIEYKYDGFRLQISKDDKGNIKLFTRRLEDVTKQFPDIVDSLKNINHTFLIDSEAVGINPKTRKFEPFQKISQRIKRKYNISELIKELPVQLQVFDILFLDGEELINSPFIERRKKLEELIPVNDNIRPSKILITGDDKEAEEFFKKSLEEGNEGVMVKKLDAPYKPGARVGFMVKVKALLDTVDLVITEAEWGVGKRSGWLTSFTICAYDPLTNDLLPVGKVGSGLKEKDEELSFEKITNLLKPLIIKEEGKTVYLKPEIIVEVVFEEIQQSPHYESGFALRFPRIINIRVDKPIEEATTIDELRAISLMQKK